MLSFNLLILVPFLVNASPLISKRGNRDDPSQFSFKNHPNAQDMIATWSTNGHDYLLSGSSEIYALLPSVFEHFAISGDLKNLGDMLEDPDLVDWSGRGNGIMSANQFINIIDDLKPMYARLPRECALVTNYFKSHEYELKMSFKQVDHYASSIPKLWDWANQARSFEAIETMATSSFFVSHIPRDDWLKTMWMTIDMDNVRLFKIFIENKALMDKVPKNLIGMMLEYAFGTGNMASPGTSEIKVKVADYILGSEALSLQVPNEVLDRVARKASKIESHQFVTRFTQEPRLLQRVSEDTRHILQQEHMFPVDVSATSEMEESLINALWRATEADDAQSVHHILVELAVMENMPENMVGSVLEYSYDLGNLGSSHIKHDVVESLVKSPFQMSQVSDESLNSVFVHAVRINDYRVLDAFLQRRFLLERISEDAFQLGLKSALTQAEHQAKLQRFIELYVMQPASRARLSPKNLEDIFVNAARFKMTSTFNFFISRPQYWEKISDAAFSQGLAIYLTENPTRMSFLSDPRVIAKMSSSSIETLLVTMKDAPTLKSLLSHSDLAAKITPAVLETLKTTLHV